MNGFERAEISMFDDAQPPEDDFFSRVKEESRVVDVNPLYKST